MTAHDPANVDYRTSPARQDTTFVYGPFPARWWPAVVALFACVVMTFLAWNEERYLLRSVECMRPGRCVIVRGADWLGPRVDTEFDADRFHRVEVRRTTGKNPTTVLWLVRVGEDELELLRGDGATQLGEQLLPFFELRAQSTLSVRLEDDLGGRSVPVLLAVAAWLALGFFLRDARRRSACFRISILRGRDLLRVEPMARFSLRRDREISLAQLVDVWVQKGPAHTQRVVLSTRDLGDFPLAPWFLGEHSGHEAIRRSLELELNSSAL